MFDEYTTPQLIELRSLCADMVERTEEVETRADTLLVLQGIEEELASREYKKTA
jgi:hypothetical protein